jgi:hypothetical protein
MPAKWQESCSQRNKLRPLRQINPEIIIWEINIRREK